jgi:hypothetical protein
MDIGVDMLPFRVTTPATVPQRSEIPEGLMNYPVYITRCSYRSQGSQFINLLKIVITMKLVKELKHKAFLFPVRDCCMLQPTVILKFETGNISDITYDYQAMT